MSTSSNTALVIIEGAIRLIKGPAYRPGNPELGAGLIALNDMLASWSADQIQVNAVVSSSFSLVIGTASYTIGSGGDISTTRPTEIKRGVYIRDSNSLDHPVDLITRERYNSIANKIVSSRPTKLYYDPTYPLATIYFNFKPDAVETVYYDALQPITEITDATATLVLPPEYKKALRYNLALELAPEYADIKIPELVILAAEESKDALIRVNTLSQEEAQLDHALVGYGGYGRSEFESGV